MNRVPQLHWKKIEIPPTRNNTSDFPKTILVHGNFQKEGIGKRALAVNGTNVKVSDAGDFILKVHTQGTEFGLLVTFKELEAAEELKQTLGFRIFTAKERTKRSISTHLGFLGRQVYNQRKIASLTLPEELATTVESLSGVEKLDTFRLHLGASFMNYEQNAYRQNPKTSFLRFSYERTFKPIFVGFDARFSIVPLNKEPGGSLQFLNPEIKVGITIHQTQTSGLRLFTGTNYFTSFGNQSLGFYSGLGQSIELDSVFAIASKWDLGLYAKATLVPPSQGTGNLFSNGELLAGVALSHNNWGVFSEFTRYHLQTSQEANLSAARFGFFTRF